MGIIRNTDYNTYVNEKVVAQKQKHTKSTKKTEIQHKNQKGSINLNPGWAKSCVMTGNNSNVNETNRTRSRTLKGEGAKHHRLLFIREQV